LNLGFRILKFNTVGLLGAGVQLAVLTALIRLARVDYLIATALAVETAVLHNFAWHERWTWKDRGGQGVAGRLLRFHLGNGLVSIVSNLLLMKLLAGTLGLHYLPANILSIAITAAANFALGEWFVYRPR